MLAALTGLEREEFTDIARRLLELGDVNSKVEEVGGMSRQRTICNILALIFTV